MSMRLLLIEDNERFAELLKRGLTAAGFVVDVIGTAAEATEILETNRFEVVVLDLGLPDADGLDVLSRNAPATRRDPGFDIDGARQPQGSGEWAG